MPVLSSVRVITDCYRFLFQNLSQTQLLRQTLNKVTEEKSLNIKPGASLDLVCFPHLIE